MPKNTLYPSSHKEIHLIWVWKPWSVTDLKPKYLCWIEPSSRPSYTPSYYSLWWIVRMKNIHISKTWIWSTHIKNMHTQLLSELHHELYCIFKMGVPVHECTQLIEDGLLSVLARSSVFLDNKLYWCLLKLSMPANNRTHTARLTWPDRNTNKQSEYHKASRITIQSIMLIEWWC